MHVDVFKRFLLYTNLKDNHNVTFSRQVQYTLRLPKRLISCISYDLLCNTKHLHNGCLNENCSLEYALQPNHQKG